jgi:MinD-like ATPase involved in chromosome partitioning or flagellar assembly
MPRQQSDVFVPELSFEEMRRMLQAARDEHDVVLVDLGVLRAGGQAAVGCALSDRVIVVAPCGEGKQRISKTLDLLDRLAPKRLLLALNRMPGADPQLADVPARKHGDNARFAWLKNPLNT